MRFLVCLSSVLAMGLLAGCGNEPDENASAPDNDSAAEEERTLYALGQLLARPVAGVSLTEDELETIVTGLGDAVLGRASEVDMDQYGPRAQMFMQARLQAAAAAELLEAAAFLEREAGIDGAVRTDSGIVIRETTAGEGPSPGPTDMVRVHYHGTLRTGEVFDSSVDRGEPATFPLDGVIVCWQEGLQTMRVGGASRLICPPELAYGASGPPGIPGNAALAFDVELLEIVTN